MPKKEARQERMNLTLTPEQSKKLNDYIINVAKKQGRVPPAVKTKLMRQAFDEWYAVHGQDFTIDWK